MDEQKKNTDEIIDPQDDETPKQRTRKNVESTGRVLIILALVIAITSLILNLMTRQLETFSSAAEPSAASDNNAHSEITSTMKLIFAGNAVYSGEMDDYSQVFSNISPMISSYDTALYTQAALVNTDIDSKFADAAVNAGFNTVGLAAHNVMSDGKEGIDKSLAYWKDTPAYISGQNSSTVSQNTWKLIEKDTLSIIYMSYTDVLDDPLPQAEDYLVNVYDDERTPVAVAKAAAQADAVIVSINWKGNEDGTVSDRQIKIANDLAYAGASVVVGCDEGHVEPVQWIDDTLVYYSLGDLADGNGAEDVGALGAVTITESFAGQVQHVELTNPKIDFIVSLPEEKGITIKLLGSVTTDEIPDRDNMIIANTTTAHLLDDSITVGTLQ